MSPHKLCPDNPCPGVFPYCEDVETLRRELARTRRKLSELRREVRNVAGGLMSRGLISMGGSIRIAHVLNDAADASEVRRKKGAR